MEDAPVPTTTVESSSASVTPPKVEEPYSYYDGVGIYRLHQDDAFNSIFIAPDTKAVSTGETAVREQKAYAERLRIKAAQAAAEAALSAEAMVEDVPTADAEGQNGTSGKHESVAGMTALLETVDTSKLVYA